MIVVSNSGPLMALGKLGLLELLPKLYGQVRLPTGVFTEVVVRGVERGRSDARLGHIVIPIGRDAVGMVSIVLGDRGGNQNETVGRHGVRDH